MGRRQPRAGFDLFAAQQAARVAPLDPEAKLLLLLLLTYVDRQGECWPSLRRLAAETGLGLATVKRRKSGLEQLGVLVVERRLRASSAGQLSAASNLYRIELAVLSRLSHPDDPGVVPAAEASGASFPVEKPQVNEDTVGSGGAQGGLRGSPGWAPGEPRVGSGGAPNSPKDPPKENLRDLTRARGGARAAVDNPEREPDEPPPSASPLALEHDAPPAPTAETLAAAKHRVETLRALLDGLQGDQRRLVQDLLDGAQRVLTKLSSEAAVAAARALDSPPARPRTTL